MASACFLCAKEQCCFATTLFRTLLTLFFCPGKLYENCSVQPRIEVTHNTFKMILPNMNAAEPLAAKSYLTPQKEQILNFISQNGQITEAEIMELLGVKRIRAYTVAKQLCDDNLIVAVGRGVNKKYIAQGCIAQNGSLFPHRQDEPRAVPLRFDFSA